MPPRAPASTRATRPGSSTWPGHRARSPAASAAEPPRGRSGTPCPASSWVPPCWWWPWRCPDGRRRRDPSQRRKPTDPRVRRRCPRCRRNAGTGGRQLSEARSARRGVRSGELPDLEDLRAAVGAGALDCRATVLHGHLLGILYLDLLALLDAITLGHRTGSFRCL